MIWVDIIEPVRNVYDDGGTITSAPTIGAVIDFAPESGNPMRGAWRVLSIERQWLPGSSAGGVIRVNVERETG